MYKLLILYCKSNICNNTRVTPTCTTFDYTLRRLTNVYKSLSQVIFLN